MAPIFSFSCLMVLFFVASKSANGRPTNQPANQIYDGPQGQCNLDEIIEVSLKESEAIVVGNFSFHFSKTRENGYASRCKVLVCNFDQHLVIKGIEQVTNDVLHLITLQHDEGKFWRKVENITNNLHSIEKFVNETRETSQYFRSQYIPVVTMTMENIAIAKRFRKDLKTDFLKQSVCSISTQTSNSILHLCADNEYYGDYEQRFVWFMDQNPSSSDCTWILEPQNDDGMFKLRNTMYNEYLATWSPWIEELEGYNIVVASKQFRAECDSRFICELEPALNGNVWLQHNITKSNMNRLISLALVTTEGPGIDLRLTCTG